MKERDIVIDIDSCKDSTMEESRSSDELSDGVIGERSKKGGGSVSSPDSGERSKKEKRMSVSGKKAPKPPRPPRGLSLDAADQKLIKEFSELLMIKRARIERMKALKKTKAAKASSASSSSGNFVAMLFTLLFCVVIIFQGCHPPNIWPRNGSPKSNGATEDSIVAFHGQQNLSPESLHMSSEVGSPDPVEQAPSSVTREGEKATH